ncbi:MAG: Protoporphyrinogen IX oxidase, aerobic, HemY [Candidatus Carbobacillus altaicus]|uniref:Coproporphyrinogen III oxidase n=1 Tax=Candidatus Carbonibacillus altaicus TaxID=2163959 RepID=A0A2R6Y439_9BACL|nr:MAG: Protoporphyrinogen IX oxidase, aerobic, HemY [Candidatus Carbobacillus altaicus]
MHYDAVIIGGGLAGLAAAYSFMETLKEEGAHTSPLRLAILEKDARFGGKVWTHRKDGIIIERGPDSFLARKTAMIKLIRKLGLIDRLVPTGPEGRGAYILFQGRLHTIPEGMSTGIPTRLIPLVKTQLLSWPGKMRALGDLILPRGSEQDEALGAFLSRRFGREVKERIAEPLLAGIYAGDTDALSIMATFPQFKDLEKRYRSLLLAMFQSRRASRHVKSATPAQGESPDQALPAHLRGSTFLSLEGGLSTVIEALYETLESSGVDLFSGRGARRLMRENDHYIIYDDEGHSIMTRSVLLAVPAFAADALLNDSALTPYFQATTYASVVNVVFCYDNEPEPKPLPGSGFVVSRGEGTLMRAATWTSRKWPHTTPNGKFLVRLYAGGINAKEATEIADVALIQRLEEELKGVVGTWPAPQSVLPTRWERAMPQYAVGHLERTKQLRDVLARNYPGLFLAGSAYDGVGLPDVLKSGAEAAQMITAYLKNVKKQEKNSLH